MSIFWFCPSFPFKVKLCFHWFWFVIMDYIVEFDWLVTFAIFIGLLPVRFDLCDYNPLVLWKFYKFCSEIKPSMWDVKKQSDSSLLFFIRWLNTVLAVCEYISFAKSWQKKGCSSQAETWQVKNILMKDFYWQVKFDDFIVSMATCTIE